MAGGENILRVLGVVVLLTAGSAAAVETVPDFGPGPYTHDCYAKNWPHEPFSVSKWNNTPKEERYRFVRSFLGLHKVVGRKKKFIIDKLGEPDSNHKKYLIYTVREFDPERCIHGFFALLQFEMDERDVVAEVYIRLD